MDSRATNKALRAVYLVFGIPFTGVGLLAIAVSMYRYVTGIADVTQTLLLTLFGLMFCAVGAGPILFLRSARKRADAEAQMQAANPDKPWMWREDWAAGHISSSNRFVLAFVWGFAIVWNLISTPLLFVFLKGSANNAAVLIMMLFPAIGVLLLIRAIRQSLAFRKFGVSDFVMAKVPGVVGGNLQGSIYAAFDPRSERNAKLKLTCIHRIVTGTGDNRSVSERIRWQDERDLGPADITPGPTGCIIPVLFHIPGDVAETDIRNMDNAIQWKLDVRADIPGIDYEAQFDVPVFRTKDSSASPEPEPNAVTPPVNSRVRIQPSTSGGMEFIFPAARNPRLTAILAVLVVFWTAWMAVFTLALNSAWAIFPSIILGVIDAFLVLFTLVSLLAERVTIDRQNITIRKSLFGISRLRQIPCSNVADLKLNIGMQTGNAEGTPYYDIQVICRDGTKRNAGGQIPNKREAAWLMNQMKQAMSR